MNTQVNLHSEIELLFKAMKELESRIRLMKKGYSVELERYVEKAEELAELHKALHKEVNRTTLNAVDEQLRRQAIVELQFEIENFRMPPAPDPSFYFTELNTSEAQLREYKNRLMRLMAHAGTLQYN